MEPDRKRLLLHGLLLTLGPLLLLELVRIAPFPRRIATMPAMSWALVVFSVLLVVAQGFGLVRLNQSRAGTWANGKAVMAVALSVCGWLLMVVYAVGAFGMLGYAMEPGHRLFQ